MDTLLNTSWQLAFAPVVSESVTYAVTLECQGVTYNSLVLDATSGRILYDSTPVYYEGWLNSNYRQIKFTGGTDIEDADLIAWVEANATPSLTQKEIFERDMTALRNAINLKARTTGKKTIKQMITAVESISTGGGGGESTLAIVTGSVQTPHYSTTSSPPVHGQSGDLADLTVNCNIPITAEVQEVKFYWCFGGYLILDSDTPVMPSASFQQVSEHTEEVVGDNLKISVTSATNSTINSFLANAKEGQLTKNGILIVMYA